LVMANKAMAVRYDEIEGKEVSGAGFGHNSMLIAFTDGTVLALTADGDCDGPEIDFAQGYEIDLLSKQWASEAREAGLITHEQWADSHKKHEAERIARLERELAYLRKAGE
jgi:hypothetical protein